jgi:hypothetical protein
MRHPTRGRWTLIAMTLIAAGLTILGVQQFAAGQSSVGLPAIVMGNLVYLFAWIIGMLDSLQARRTGWTLAQLLLLPFGVGPLLYALFGLRATPSTSSVPVAQQEQSDPAVPSETEQSQHGIDVG